MAKVQIGKWQIEEDELDQQHAEAIQRGEQKLQTEPQAKAVSYEQATNCLVIELKNGVIFQLPCTLVQGLATANPEDIAEIFLGPRGASLHWEKLKLSFSLVGLIAGVFGTRAWMEEIGRIGGSVTSVAKTDAARLNGKKGGRPSKSKPKERTLQVAQSE